MKRAAILLRDFFNRDLVQISCQDTTYGDLVQTLHRDLLREEVFYINLAKRTLLESLVQRFRKEILHTDIA